jgi:hypothetical protein
VTLRYMLLRPSIHFLDPIRREIAKAREEGYFIVAMGTGLVYMESEIR